MKYSTRQKNSAFLIKKKFQTKVYIKTSFKQFWRTLYDLTANNKERRVVISKQLLDTLHRRISRRLVVIDEKWVYYKNKPSSAHQHFWVDSAGDRPKLPKATLTNAKNLLIMAVNFHGERYFELLQHGRTIDSARYVEFLQNMIQNLDMPPEQILIMHGHTCLV